MPPILSVRVEHAVNENAGHHFPHQRFPASVYKAAASLRNRPSRRRGRSRVLTIWAMSPSTGAEVLPDGQTSDAAARESAAAADETPLQRE